jgi:SCY1-like protein 1
MLKLLAKSQMDPEYGIRTNTTVLLAKIAVYLSSATRQKILAAAFCRALKDPHPKARVAGVMGLEHTLNYYSKEDCATKVIPTLAFTLIDPEK